MLKLSDETKMKTHVKCVPHKNTENGAFPTQVVLLYSDVCSTTLLNFEIFVNSRVVSFPNVGI